MLSPSITGDPCANSAVILWSPDRLVWFGLVSLPPLGTGVIDVVLAKHTPLTLSALPFHPGLFQFLVLFISTSTSPPWVVFCLRLAPHPSLVAQAVPEREKKNPDQVKTKRENWGEKGKFSSGAFSLRQAQAQPHSSPALIAFLFLVYSFVSQVTTHDTTLSAFSL